QGCWVCVGVSEDGERESWMKVLEENKKKLTVNGNDTIGFDKSNVECYNYHKRGHFARECRAPRSQDTNHKESTRRTVPVETPVSTALIVGNCKKRLRYKSYNEVPPSYTKNFMPPNPDLSYTRLDEFVHKSVVENCDAKTSETKPKDVRKNNDVLIIKEWVSDDDEEEVIQPKIEQKIVKPSIPRIEFVKQSNQRRKLGKLLSRDLQLEDAEGVNCLPNAAIFEQLTLMGKTKRKDTELPQTSGPTTNIADEAVNEEMNDSLKRAATTDSILKAEHDSGNINKN
nr:hypothetical protein [Tanacetum cinerariifolium]